MVNHGRGWIEKKEENSRRKINSVEKVGSN